MHSPIIPNIGRFFGRPDQGAPAGQSVERGFNNIIHGFKTWHNQQSAACPCT